MSKDEQIERARKWFDPDYPHVAPMQLEDARIMVEWSYRYGMVLRAAYDDLAQSYAEAIGMKAGHLGTVLCDLEDPDVPFRLCEYKEGSRLYFMAIAKEKRK